MTHLRAVGDDTDTPPPDAAPWQAAIASALAHGAVWGVLIYVNADEAVGREPIGIQCGRHALLSLVEEVAAEIRAPSSEE